MTPPPIICTNLRRIIKPDSPAVAGVTLRIPAWRLTMFGGIWLRDGGGERIVLPRREWVEPGGVRRIADIFMFDDYGAQEHFEQTALAAAKRLRKVAAR
jgi:hypothetical protein